MAPVGQACLILALATCAYGIGASIYGARSGRRDWVASGRRSVYGLALLIPAIAWCALLGASLLVRIALALPSA